MPPLPFQTRTLGMDTHVAWLATNYKRSQRVSDVRSHLLPSKLKYIASGSDDDKFMAIPRSQLIDLEQPPHYHLISKCVRRSWLCGKDPHSRKDCEHRKTRLEERIFQLAQCFAAATDAFAIISNHFHLAVYFEPQVYAKEMASPLKRPASSQAKPESSEMVTFGVGLSTLLRNVCRFSRES
ncbi:MAG: hypothetical protein ACI8Z1_001744 [Candidatus Azotimanducaceae bacterium]|jgi:hypothetical protein